MNRKQRPLVCFVVPIVEVHGLLSPPSKCRSVGLFIYSLRDFYLSRLEVGGGGQMLVCQPVHLKAGLHRNANTNAACENNAYVHVGKFVDCTAFAEAANRPYINVLYVNSLWCTDSRRIAFGCLPNIRHTAECCLPRLKKTSTSNIRIIFACRVRVCVLFAFRCKRGFTSVPQINLFKN